jgi:hypothetical protein
MSDRQSRNEHENADRQRHHRQRKPHCQNEVFGVGSAERPSTVRVQHRGGPSQH